MVSVSPNASPDLLRLPFHSRYERLGLRLEESDGWLVPAGFQSLGAELSLLKSGCGIVDFSDRGVLELSGKDATDFLHRISTNELNALNSGEALQTVLVTEKGRVIDSILVVRGDGNLSVITSRGAPRRVKEWLERFIISEDVGVRDRTGERVLFACMNGRKAPQLVRTESHMLSFVTKYFTVNTEFYLAEKDESALTQFEESGYSQVGNDAYEAFRIEQGIPNYQKEMTGEFNPLELNLRDQISFDKGCYIGQEVIARLDTYQKAQRCLCLVKMEGSVFLRESYVLTSDGKEIGRITSHSPNLLEHGFVRGLAVIRKECAVGGSTVRTKDGGDGVMIERVFEG